MGKKGISVVVGNGHRDPCTHWSSLSWWSHIYFLLQPRGDYFTVILIYDFLSLPDDPEVVQLLLLFTSVICKELQLDASPAGIVLTRNLSDFPHPEGRAYNCPICHR